MCSLKKKKKAPYVRDKDIIYALCKFINPTVNIKKGKLSNAIQYLQSNHRGHQVILGDSTMDEKNQSIFYSISKILIVTFK